MTIAKPNAQSIRWRDRRCRTVSRPRIVRPRLSPSTQIKFNLHSSRTTRSRTRVEWRRHTSCDADSNDGSGDRNVDYGRVGNSRHVGRLLIPQEGTSL
ncbi:hypothetical protein BD410DRAFT_790545 [Rickenella mellea]|uniref:Uncharacterized protein n=1 Tax=Rickenella mellea TaxID=50990 RepID=A0A4Y7PZN7_9AGAM|nr:hypothetical protein BD410DRAFT_790545 [Rickenella mellea]